MLTRLLRLTAAAVAGVLAIRLLDWLLAPVLPTLLTLLVLGGILYVAVNGWRRS